MFYNQQLNEEMQTAEDSEILAEFDEWWNNYSPPTSEDYPAARDAWYAATKRGEHFK